MDKQTVLIVLLVIVVVIAIGRFYWVQLKHVEKDLEGY